MNEFINYLRRFAELKETDIALIRRHTREISLARDDYFLECDNIPTRLGFLTKGVLRAGYCGPRGRETIRFFISGNCFASDIHSFQMRLPSRECIRAVTDATLIILSPDSLRVLSALIPAWNPMMTRICNNVIVERLVRRGTVTGETAYVRYLEFSRRYPGLADVIAPSYVALYLGVSTSTVSRIRRRATRY